MTSQVTSKERASAGSGGGGSRLPSSRVKNKAPSEVQITAEQLLREASERSDALLKPIRQKVTSAEEAGELRLIKRKNFEDALRRNRTSIGTWLKYAAYEERLREFTRARSLYERVLEIEPRNIVIWLKYAEMEMRNKNINLTRNVWNRAITLLPFVEQFWYKYAYFEEILGNVEGARQVFERWMEWQPKDTVWSSYIKLEVRYKEFERARAIWDRLLATHPTSKNWIKYAKFEEELNDTDRTRSAYEHSIEALPKESREAKLFISFAKFEIKQQELERARVIFKFGIENLPKEKAEFVEKQYVLFEKQFGTRDEMEYLILKQRREKYEEKLALNSYNYDVWFDYIRLEEDNGTEQAVRSLFERAVSQVPPIKEKKHWKRYIYLWIYYAVYEELFSLKDTSQVKHIYQRCLELIPHTVFTFAKVWELFAKFYLRRKDLTSARKLLGRSIGMCPKDRLFKVYIEMELSLQEFDRCRILYQKYLLWKSGNSKTWIRYAEMEKLLGDTDRARAIFGLAVSQPLLEMPEILWTAYIDFEVEEEELDNARNLFEQMLVRTEHLKVWIGYGQMEALSASNMELARSVFDRGYISLRDQGLVEERIRLLEAWRALEQEHGDEESVQKIQNKFPKRMSVYSEEDGEEILQWVFPEDLPAQPHHKLLQMAYQWKKNKDMENAMELSEDENNEYSDEEKDKSQKSSSSQSIKRERDQE